MKITDMQSVDGTAQLASTTLIETICSEIRKEVSELRETVKGFESVLQNHMENQNLHTDDRIDLLISLFEECTMTLNKIGEQMPEQGE